MVIKKVLEFNTINPVSIIKPIKDINGNIMNDLCISDDCKVYKYSEVLNKEYLSDCIENPIYIKEDDHGRLYAPINPIKADKSNSQLARTLLFEFDKEKHDKEWYDDKTVDHINPSIPVSNNISNLRWTTHQENMKFAAKTGVMVKKYKKPLIDEICQLISDGKSRCEIMEELGINGQLIDDIRAGRSHKDISSKYGFEYSDKHRKPRNERIIVANEICKMLEQGISNSDICRALGVQSGLVTSIAKGISFKDVSCNYNL